MKERTAPARRQAVDECNAKIQLHIGSHRGGQEGLDSGKRPFEQAIAIEICWSDKEWRDVIQEVSPGVVLMVAQKEMMRPGYEISLHGTKRWRSVTPNLANLYAYLLEAFLDLALTDKESVPIEEEVEVIAALEAAQRSLELGREVQLSEVLG